MSSFSLAIIEGNLNRNDHVAIIDRNGTRKTTWSALYESICRVATYARQEGLRGVVPVSMERGVEAAATLLGLNLAGVGVAPLAVTTPQARLELISRQVENAVWTMETYERAVDITPDYSLVAPGRAGETERAYVVFTSGSTGTPKGVVLNNAAILGGMSRAASPDFFGLTEDDRVLQCSSLSFIALAADLLAPLWMGALVHVLPEEGRGDVRMISEYVNRCGITKLFMSPQLYRSFEGGPSLRCVCIGGDKIRNLAPKGHRLVSVYGMTEMAGFAFHYDITESMPSTPVGVPCEGLRAYVLDENGEPAEEGEMCVSGAVSGEYLDRPELNATAFTANPFSDDPGHSFLLHSGDIVRRLPEGGFRYLNRKDNMLKINGQRVEPGEIEIVMTDFPGVTQAAVKGFTDDEQRSILCAYYTANAPVDEEALRGFLAAKLPRYMVPVLFVALEAMPLNQNGKLDRPALQKPDLNALLDRYEAPETNAERMVCRGFEAALGIERVGRNDDFFRLGGDSIGALTVVRECGELDISTGDIFAGRTPKAVAALAIAARNAVFDALPAYLRRAPLTASQMGILLECGMDEGHTKYVIPVHLRFPRSADMTAETVKHAVDRMLYPHPALYAAVAAQEGQFYMLRQLFPEGGICTAREGDAEDIAALSASFVRPLTLGHDPLCSAEALLGEEEVHIFLLLHHIVSDGTSVSILCRELAELLSGREPEGEGVDAFALAEVERRQRASGEESARTYFESLLSGAESDPNLLPDHKPLEEGRRPYARVTLGLKAPELSALLRETELTESSFFMGVFGYTLAKMTGQSECVFAAAENGRGSSRLGSTVSMLVRTLPVVIRFDENSTGREALSALQAQFFATMRHDCIPFAELARQYGVSADVMFVYQSDMLSGANGDFGVLSAELPQTPEAPVNFNAQVCRTPEGYTLLLEYRRDLYEEATIRRFGSLFERAASAFTGEAPLREIPLISEEDRCFLDAENHRDERPVPAGTMVELFRDTARRFSEKTALISGERSYTYAQIDEVTDRLAAELHRRGIGRKQFVAVLISRGEYMVLCSLGVLKAGAAYEPLDPSYPPERLNFMVEDADAALLIADRSLVDILSGYRGDVLYTDEIASLPAAELPDGPAPEDTFCLLYTSGTTGTPKGCMIGHRNVMAYLEANRVCLGVDESTVYTGYASYGFDAHIHDLYPALCCGGSVVMVPDEIKLDLSAVRDLCESCAVTHLFMTTQVARQFATQFPVVEHLRVLNCGGEKLISFTPSGSYRVLNLYGPSETIAYVTGFEVDRLYDSIPIGRHTLNNRLYVIDSLGRRVPVGVPGELVICGPQVGKGYLHRPEQTAAAFVPNTFEEDVDASHQRCYRTGDIVRCLADGNLEFIGRRDLQVKIRGFRVELGEVEHALREYPDITDATVAVLETSAGKSLCGYVVSPETVDIEALHRFIRQSHPAYMVPAATVQLERIPLTVNGKVDKRKLPRPELRCEDVTAPETELQRRIFDKAVEAIGFDGFGIHTDLFEAGLSSIGSIRLCSLLAEDFGVPVQLRTLKKNETVAKLESFLRETMTKNASVAESETAPTAEFLPDHPISKTMEGIYVECISRPESTVYNIPYLARLGAGIDEARLKAALVSAVAAHPYLMTELFTAPDGTIRQHRRTESVFTERDIGLVEAYSLAEVKDTLVHPFRLNDSRLFEISLLHADGLYLFLHFHHIIADGTSIMVFLSDVERAYRGESLAAESYTGFDVADDEAAERSGEALTEAKEYYAELLEGLDRDFLPLADKYAELPESDGHLQLTQREADGGRVREFCAARRLGMNAYFTSVFGLVLARYAGTEYSVFNTVYNGRNDPRRASTFSMLVKTLPVVCHTDRDTITALTAEMAAQLTDSMANDICSYGELTQSFGVRNDVMFIYQGDSFTRSSFCGAEAEEIPLTLSEAKTAMTLQVMLLNGQLVYDLEYDPKRFTERFARAFVLAFDCAAAAFLTEQSPSCVSLLSPETEAELEVYNRTAYDYDRGLTIIDHFLTAVRRQPEALCVAYKNTRLCFDEVGEITGRIALHLMRKGIGRGDVAAILIRRDENMVLSAHGVLRAGAAYLGLDPTYPTERLEFMLADSGAGILIADRGLMELLPDYHGEVLYTDEFISLPADEAALAALAAQEEHHVLPEDDALIIYSSGTTGQPKGSVLRHRNIVCFYQNYSRDVELMPGARAATYASFGFDGGAQDVLCCPMAGASLYVIPDEIRMDMSALEQFYVRNAITSGFITTQVGTMFVSATRCTTLRHFIVGGEKLIPVLAPEWVCFRNCYGPSETMCYVNKYIVHDTGALQPIGKVSGNTKEYVIDRFGNRLPFGACGELCISGGQVGRGYLNRPEKTAEVFAANPFSSEAEYRVMYRTGDVVRLLPDGNYDFVGRRDGQVKIRGFRVELSEVEQQLRRFPGIEKAVVLAYDNPAGGKFLAAFIVAEGEPDIEELRRFIGSEKPDYMIPAVIERLEEIPLTSNGKVDARRLPKPRLGAVRKGAEPADEAEETICHIFGAVLGLDKVYADDDFFAIGGSSISAIQVVVRCEQVGFPVVYKNLFAEPTAQKLAAFLRGGAGREDVMAADLEQGDGHDYSALRGNVPENLPKLRYEGVGDVLLTGATGFLGSHVFRELVNSTDATIYCLVRSKGEMDALTRFEMMMVYYFEDWYQDEQSRRVVIIDGDLEDTAVGEKLRAVKIDTIINCAANVKHFAAGDELVASNFSGVERLISFAEEKGARLIQISSLSVGGESVNGSVPAGYLFRETDLNIGQSLENKYIYSKYLAEQALIDAVSRGRIRGKVIRLGNLMARIEDSEFQVNAGTSGFLRLFLGFNRLGCFPLGMMDAYIEFSPIDAVARAVVLLSGTPDEFTVFHAKNCNAIHYSYFLESIRRAGRPIQIVEDAEFERRLELALQNEADVTELGGLLAYRNTADGSMTEISNFTGRDAEAAVMTRVKIGSDTSFTAKALYRLGFAWPLISREYLDRMTETLIDLNYF